MLRQGPRRRTTSVLNRPLIVSASALSWLSPTLPTDGSRPASASRSVYRIDRYCPAQWREGELWRQQGLALLAIRAEIAGG
jgi:hypothetical protein